MDSPPERLIAHLRSVSNVSREEGYALCLEETADLLEAIRSEEAQVVYPCTTHAEHRGSIPLFKVTSWRFGAGAPRTDRVTLECGHMLILPGGMVTSRDELLPCVWCAEDCHS